LAIRNYLDIAPSIVASAFIDETALVIGDVTIGEEASLWPMVVARGDVNSIIIGARTNIQDGSVLHVTGDNEFNPGGYPLVVGEDVTVGHGAILHACTIGNFSLVGMGATLLDGAVIEDHVMVGAGALVAPGKTLESGFLYVGSPARQARPLKEKELAWLEYSSGYYVALKNKHMNGAC